MLDDSRMLNFLIGLYGPPQTTRNDFAKEGIS